MTLSENTLAPKYSPSPVPFVATRLPSDFQAVTAATAD